MVYRNLREQQPTLPWTKAIWIVGGIPKHGFLAWLFALNRNPTRDRLHHWGLATATDCLLCANHMESRDHLYFECAYSWELWSIFAGRLGLTPARDWEGSLNQMQNLTGNKFWKRILLLYWQATIYWTWMERNCRLHRNTTRTVASMFPLIDRLMKEKILSVRDSNPASSSSLMQVSLQAIDGGYSQGN